MLLTAMIYHNYNLLSLFILIMFIYQQHVHLDLEHTSKTYKALYINLYNGKSYSSLLEGTQPVVNVMSSTAMSPW